VSDHDTRAEFKASRDAGLRARHARRLAYRWQNVDDWLTQYERSRDPYGTYSVPGRDPAKVITKAAS
jgi:hypothetical protein